MSERPTILTSRRQVMVDIETLGQNETGTPAVFEIGLVLFDPLYTGTLAGADLRCCPFDALAEGWAHDLETLRWHIKKKTNLLRSSSLLSLSEIVGEALEFLTINNFDFIWAKAPDFDLDILKKLFAHYYPKAALPWEYWQARDVRTLADLDHDAAPDPPHRAYQDAIIEAEAVSRVIRRFATSSGSAGELTHTSPEAIAPFAGTTTDDSEL